MVSLGTIAYTLIGRLLIIIACILLAVPLLICLLLPQRFLIENTFFNAIAQIFYWYCVRFSFLPIQYTGLHNIPQEPCIIVANHQSSFDIPLVGYALGSRPHVWLAWAKLKDSVLLRLILPRISVLVDTSTPMTGMRTLLQAITTIQEKPWDLIIFPEGGRFTDGKIHEFFGGFAMIAKKVPRPIVPIKIIDAYRVYPPHTFWIYYHPITVHIGKPMHMLPDETEDAFKDRVHQWFTADHRD